MAQDLEAIIGVKSTEEEIWKLFANPSIDTMINVLAIFRYFRCVMCLASN